MFPCLLDTMSNDHGERVQSWSVNITSKCGRSVRNEERKEVANTEK